MHHQACTWCLNLGESPFGGEMTDNYCSIKVESRHLLLEKMAYRLSTAMKTLGIGLLFTLEREKYNVCLLFYRWKSNYSSDSTIY